MPKQMPHIMKSSTGERYVSIPIQIRVTLNNTPLTIDIVNDFLDYAQLGDVSVILSLRQTKHRWGTAWKKQKRVVLYRHSAWMLLHELAHIKAPNKSGHNCDFGRTLDDLYAQWVEFVDCATITTNTD